MTATSTKIWYPHHLEDYARKTGHLSLMEHGAYRLMMDAYWNIGGPLPLDENRLRRLIRADKDEWAEVRDVVLSFFTQADDGWSHSRIDEEIEKAGRLRQEKAMRIAKAREAKQKKAKNTDDEVIDDNSVDMPVDSTEDSLVDRTVHRTVNRDVDKPVKPTPSPLPTPPHVTNVTQVPSSQFDDWPEKAWNLYPHPPNRGSKAKAIGLLEKIPKDQRLTLSHAIADYIAWKKAKPELSTCMMVTWLNQERWKTEIDLDGLKNDSNALRTGHAQATPQNRFLQASEKIMAEIREREGYDDATQRHASPPCSDQLNLGHSDEQHAGSGEPDQGYRKAI